MYYVEDTIAQFLVGRLAIKKIMQRTGPHTCSDELLEKTGGPFKIVVKTGIIFARNFGYSWP